ncbi:uncharacterized protein LOC110687117 [Chenopodium quinoa]|uniref:uncharacterized protein LOC110687117 n=1 Tax=Chenopodium quinoa TaxID=63459 RepID=UPI000B778424|nr:uncharacterized protein LOC110687117 [Chenopodium quinoa]
MRELQIHENCVFPQKMGICVSYVVHVVVYAGCVVCLANGTWVSGRRLEPYIRTRINEFDTLKIGRSEKNYKLQWIPLSKFCDISNPFLVPSAPPMTQDINCNMTSELDSTTAGDGNIQQNGANPTIEIDPTVDKVYGDNLSTEDHNRIRPWDFWSVHTSPVCSPLSSNTNGVFTEWEQSRKHQYPDNDIEPRDDTILHNSSDEDRNGIKLWDFWSRNMGIESPICSSLSETEVSSNSENKSLENGKQSPPLNRINRPIQSPPLSSMRRLESFQNPPNFHLRTPYQTPPASPTNRPSSSLPQRRMRGPSLSLPHILMRRPSESQLITSGPTSASCSWFRAGLLCSDINRENSTSSSSHKEKFAADSPKFLKNLQKARRASLKKAKSFPQKETKRERKPFQSLFERLANALPRKSIDAANSKTIILVVDTTTLLANKSRRALQLLEGLEGTQLIIPITVIKNLAYLNQEVSFLKESTEVSLALEWIKDCMAEIPWWIHVYDPAEEGLLATPTRPQAGSSAFSALEPPPEILLPTVEDHVLGCANSFRRNNNNDGHLVLLSSDKTLKIKAMAVGMACETAEEFIGSFR